MSDQPSFRIRVFFKKSGRLAMLSHLEVARALERAIRRARLPYAISQGFSPHMKIAFGAALPVGVGGERECFDLQMTRYIAPDELLDALRKASVEDLMILDGEYVGTRTPAASVAYPVSSYRVQLSEPLPAEPVIPEVITVIRKKKERQLTVAEHLMDDFVSAGGELSFSLLSLPTGSLRPDKFVAALLEDYPEVRVISITRVDQRAV